jgi:hypothetical protein
MQHLYPMMQKGQIGSWACTRGAELARAAMIRMSPATRRDNLRMVVLLTMCPSLLRDGYCTPQKPLDWIPYSSSNRSRSEFAITDTELKLIAAAAKMGDSRMPNVG